MELNEQEKVAKLFMENRFTPTLHNLLSTANPEAYKKWGGNACRQTAIMGVHFLKEFLPSYEWTAWDGDFSDIVGGIPRKYNHAWIHGIDKKNKRGLLVDLSRVDRERLFIPVKENKYPRNHPEYKNMKLIRKEKIDIEKNMLDQEYYTMLRGHDLLEKLIIDSTKGLV
jgi:hypothetical protein